jgi:aminopeptidase N
MTNEKNYWRLRWNATQQLQGLLAPFWSTEPVALNQPTLETLQQLIRTEKMWIRAVAINFLGMTHDTTYMNVYLEALDDDYDRVVNAAANAIGRCKHEKSFMALDKLLKRPSWKNQSRISALNGLKWLGDPRGADIAYQALTDLNAPHWTLGTPIWDYRLTAAETLAALGSTEKGYDFLYLHFQKACTENDLHGIFYNTLLVATLGDPRGQVVFDQLKIRFKSDPNAMSAIENYESLFQQTKQ